MLISYGIVRCNVYQYTSIKKDIASYDNKQMSILCQMIYHIIQYNTVIFSDIHVNENVT